MGATDRETVAARVLVVDDDPRIVDLLRTLLTRAGYAVQTAADGHAALESIAAEAPDLLVTDVLMPGLVGWSLLARARRHAPTLPALILSGVQDLPTRGDGPAPATAFLRKPFAARELLAAVARLTAPGQAATPGRGAA